MELLPDQVAITGAQADALDGKFHRYGYYDESTPKSHVSFVTSAAERVAQRWVFAGETRAAGFLDLQNVI